MYNRIRLLSVLLAAAWLFSLFAPVQAAFPSPSGDTPNESPLDGSTFTVTPKIVDPGGTLNFTIYLMNSSGETLTNIALTNPMVPEITYVADSLSATSGSANFSSNTVSWLGSLDVGASVTITYQATVNPNTPLLTVIQNYAFVYVGTFALSIPVSAQVRGLYTYIPVIYGKNPCEGEFFDDFSKTTSGWWVGNEPEFMAQYVVGEYQMLAKDPNYYYYVKAPTCKQQNYTIEVDARWAGNTGEGYGLIFGLSGDLNSYYMFWVNSDYQDFALGVKTASGFRMIQNYKSSSAIYVGMSINHLKITRNGNQIQAWINGTLVGTWNDSTLAGLTNTGLVNIPYTDLANADARFDNFRVTLLPGLPGTLSAPLEVAGQACEIGQGTPDSAMSLGAEK